MRLEPFAMERLQSTWENRVAWNLSESGVHPLRLEELADTEEDRAALFAQELAYTQTNGTPDLRSAISAMYPGSGPEHIEVTNGGSEANCVVLWHLVERGDDVVMNFDMDGFLRIGFGTDPAHLSSALERVGEVMDAIPEETGDWRHSDLCLLDSRRHPDSCLLPPASCLLTPDS